MHADNIRYVLLTILLVWEREGGVEVQKKSVMMYIEYIIIIFIFSLYMIVYDSMIGLEF